MNKTQKSDEIRSVQSKFDNAAAAVLIDFAGLTVDTVTTLRREFRKSGVEYKVVKNTLIRHALKDSKYSKLVGKLGGGGERTAHVALQGMTGVAWCKEDPSAAAKVIVAFKKTTPNAGKLKVKAGLLGGSLQGADWVENEMSKLPGLKELQAQTLATIQAPAQNVVATLNAPAQNLVYLLDAWRRKLEEQQGG